MSRGRVGMMRCRSMRPVCMRLGRVWPWRLMGRSMRSLSLVCMSMRGRTSGVCRGRSTNSTLWPFSLSCSSFFSLYLLNSSSSNSFKNTYLSIKQLNNSSSTGLCDSPIFKIGHKKRFRKAKTLKNFNSKNLNFIENGHSCKKSSCLGFCWRRLLAFGLSAALAAASGRAACLRRGPWCCCPREHPKTPSSRRELSINLILKERYVNFSKFQNSKALYSKVAFLFIIFEWKGWALRFGHLRII